MQTNLLEISPQRHQQGVENRLDHRPALTSPSTVDARSARLVDVARRLLDEADARQKFIPGVNLREPVWPTLLDLYIHSAEHRPVCVTSACIAARAPHTTALRRIGDLVEQGLVERIPDPNDRRRAHLKLSAQTFADMTQYLASIAGIDAMHAEGANTLSETSEIQPPSLVRAYVPMIREA